jgi:hypothetical protein
MRECGCSSTGVCLWARAHVALLIQHKMRMRHILLSFVAFLAPPYFSTLSNKRHDFRKEVTAYEFYSDFLHNFI